MAEEERLTGKVGRKDFRKSGRAGQLLEDPGSHRRKDVPFPAETDPFAHHPADSDKRHGRCSAIVPQSGELIGEPLQAARRDDAAQRQFGPRGHFKVAVGQVTGKIVRFAVLRNKRGDFGRRGFGGAVDILLDRNHAELGAELGDQFRNVGGEIPHRRERIPHQPEPGALQVRNDLLGFPVIANLLERVGIGNMAGEDLVRNAVTVQQISQIVRTVHPVVGEEFGVAVRLVDREELLRVPDDDRQTRLDQGGQRRLARRVAEEEDHQRIDILGFKAAHLGADRFAAVDRFAEKDLVLLFQGGDHLAANPVFAVGPQFGGKRFVKFEGKGQKSEFRTPGGNVFLYHNCSSTFKGPLPRADAPKRETAQTRGTEGT